MPDCDILEDDGSAADIETGDIITTNGGMLGLGHAGIIEVRGDRIVVIEVMAAPDGSVHVQERDICDFLDDYESQDRDVFVSRPRKPAGVSDEEWPGKLQRVVEYVRNRVCTRYPVWQFGLDVLFHLPDVWYCSDLVREAFRSEGIELEIEVALENASDDVQTREFMFLWKGEVVRRFGAVQGDRFLRGFALPAAWVDPERSDTSNGPPGRRLALGRRFDSLESMVGEQVWKKYVASAGEMIDSEFKRFGSTLKGT